MATAAEATDLADGRTTSIGGSRVTRVMRCRANPGVPVGRAVSTRTSRAGTAMTMVPGVTNVVAAVAGCTPGRAVAPLAVVRGASASGR